MAGTALQYEYEEVFGIINLECLLHFIETFNLFFIKFPENCNRLLPCIARGGKYNSFITIYS